jgi:hypothetical protein
MMDNLRARTGEISFQEADATESPPRSSARGASAAVSWLGGSADGVAAPELEAVNSLRLGYQQTLKIHVLKVAPVPARQ